MPTSPCPTSTTARAFFGRDRFTYEPARDVYRCPGGQELRFRKHKYTERTRVYQAPAAACNACPLKAQCTTSAKGRQVKRSFDEAYLERVRGYHATEAFAKAMRKRQVWVEPLFAEAKDWHGLRRFRLRGLPKVNMEGLLIAAGQNLKRLLSWRGWGRRPFPTGEAGGLFGLSHSRWFAGTLTAPFLPGQPAQRECRHRPFFNRQAHSRNHAVPFFALRA